MLTSPQDQEELEAMCSARPADTATQGGGDPAGGQPALSSFASPNAPTPRGAPPPASRSSVRGR